MTASYCHMTAVVHVIPSIQNMVYIISRISNNRLTSPKPTRNVQFEYPYILSDNTPLNCVFLLNVLPMLVRTVAAENCINRSVTYSEVKYLFHNMPFYSLLSKHF